MSVGLQADPGLDVEERSPLGLMAEERLRLAEEALLLARGFCDRSRLPEPETRGHWWGSLMWAAGRHVRSVGCQVDLDTDIDVLPEDFDRWFLGGGWDSLGRDPGLDGNGSFQSQ